MGYYFDKVVYRTVEKELNQLYNPPYRHFMLDSSSWDRFELTREKQMENKITDWVVRNGAGQCISWHTNRNDAVSQAEKNARNHPGTKFFVSKVEPVTMSVTTNVTTTVL